MYLFDVLKENLRVRSFVMLLDEIQNFLINYFTVGSFLKFNIIITPETPVIYGSTYLISEIQKGIKYQTVNDYYEVNSLQHR